MRSREPICRGDGPPVFRIDLEHIYRHHRRYRITEGAEEIQMRRVAGYLFGFMKQRAPKGVVES